MSFELGVAQLISVLRTGSCLDCSAIRATHTYLNHPCKILQDEKPLDPQRAANVKFTIFFLNGDFLCVFVLRNIPVLDVYYYIAATSLCNNCKTKLMHCAPYFGLLVFYSQVGVGVGIGVGIGVGVGIGE